MVYAQFDPGAPANSEANSDLSGLNAGMSMMERATRNQEEQQTMAIQRAHEAVLQPAIAAKARADIAETAANIDNLAQTQNMRAAATAMLPQARSDFHNIMLETDPNKRLQDGYDWISRYGQLGNIQAFKPEFDTYKEAIAQTYTENLAMEKMKAQSDMMKTIWAQRGQNAQTVAGINANARLGSARLMSDARQPQIVKLADAMTSAQDPTTKAAIQDQINRLNYIRPETKSAYLQAVQAYNQATASGDQQNAALYKAQIDKLNAANPMTAMLATAFGAGAPGSPAPGAAAPGPTAAAAPPAAASANPSAPAPSTAAGQSAINAAGMSPAELQRFFFGQPAAISDDDGDPGANALQ